MDHLHVICTVSNPRRYKSRYELYRRFKEHCLAIGVHLWTVEVAYGNRDFEVTSASDPRALQLRTNAELWHKENSLNLIVSRLPSDWKYVCWVDADVTFARYDVLEETWHQLQHHPVVQMWSNAVDLDPDGRSLKTSKSFAACYLDGGCRNPTDGQPYSYAHTGYAWAMRRDAFDQVGGFFDVAPLGSADYYMAWGMIQQLDGHLALRLKQGFTPAYVNAIRQWQTNAAPLRADVGVVEGMLVHHWHGKKIDRGYTTREQILINNKYDPALDIKRDWQGLYQYSDRNPRLALDIRAYLKSRNEDSIDR